MCSSQGVIYSLAWMESAFHAYYRNVRFYDSAPSRLADKEAESDGERGGGILISVAAAKD